MPPCRQCNSAVLRPGRSAYPSGPVDVGPQHRIGPDQQDCTHSCRGRCQALQSSSSAPLFESPARLSRREGGAGHSISFPLRLEEVARANALDCDMIEIWFADEARIGQKNKLPVAGRREAPGKAHRVTSVPTTLTSWVRSDPSKAKAQP